MTDKAAGGATSQELKTPSNAGSRNQFAPNMTTPTRATQTPRSTTNNRSVGGRGGLGDVLTHKKLSHRRLAIYDRVYGQILFPPVIRLFIDSPEVQRLRDLKQLGNSHYVYPSATHTRFEHSLGVSHLAMTFLKQILTNHAEEPWVGERLLPVLSQDGSADMQKEISCVGIAGLCHDLGHGPLSHMFEHYVNRIRKVEGKEPWSHEDASISMLRAIWHSKEPELASFGLGKEDLAFVELLIRGLPPKAEWPSNVGRSADMRFLTDIIANKRNGLDVDKIDYLQRDSLSCFGSPALVSLDRLFQGACVMRDEAGETQICYQSKLDGTIEEIFAARTRLHRIVYQHRVTCVMDKMVTDVFLLADKQFKIAHNGGAYRLSECVDVPGAYVQTGDWVLNAILRSGEPKLADACHILDRMQNRRIYTTIGTTLGITGGTSGTTCGFSQTAFIRRVGDEQLRMRLTDWRRDLQPEFPVLEQIHTKITKVSGDMKDVKDPIDAISFYNPRHGADAAPYLRSKDKSSSCTSELSQSAEPEQTFIVICRMPITADELNLLSITFDDMAFNSGAAGITNRSLSPHLLRDPSGGRSDRTPRLSQHLPSTAQPRGDGAMKRERAEEKDGDGGVGSGSATGTQEHTAQVAGDLMAPPQVLLQQQHQQQQKQQQSSHRQRQKPQAGMPYHDVDIAEDDVELSMHPLSQVDNSCSNPQEPEIRIHFSNVSYGNEEVHRHKDDDEGSHLGPPTDSNQTTSTAKRARFDIIPDAK